MILLSFHDLWQYSNKFIESWVRQTEIHHTKLDRTLTPKRDCFALGEFLGCTPLRLLCFLENKIDFFILYAIHSVIKDKRRHQNYLHYRSLDVSCCGRTHQICRFVDLLKSKNYTDEFICQKHGKLRVSDL